MKLFRQAALFLAVLALTVTSRVCAQSEQPAPPKPQPSRNEQLARITIEVSGGENATPVENASVYLKYVEEHKLKKDKKMELNVKTNREGVAHIPDAPMGRVLIQIVAEGWRSYGRWYDINEAKQTIKINLEKPPRWY
jgi:hypothetical protein